MTVRAFFRWACDLCLAFRDWDYDTLPPDWGRFTTACRDGYGTEHKLEYCLCPNCKKRINAELGRVSK